MTESNKKLGISTCEASLGTLGSCNYRLHEFVASLQVPATGRDFSFFGFTYTKGNRPRSYAKSSNFINLHKTVNFSLAEDNISWIDGKLQIFSWSCTENVVSSRWSISKELHLWALMHRSRGIELHRLSVIDVYN